MKGACCHLQGTSCEEAEIDGVKRVCLVLGFVRSGRVKQRFLEDSYRDTVKNLLASHRTVLVLSSQVEGLHFLHNCFPLLFSMGHDDEVSDGSRSAFSCL